MGTILIGLYIACELIANVTASKSVQLGWIVVPAAISIDIVSLAPLSRYRRNGALAGQADR